MGNKTDKEDQRQVSYAEGNEMAEHYGLRFVETSAKESRNVDQAFDRMCHEILKVRNSVPRQPSNGEIQPVVNLRDGKKLNKKSPESRCC